MNQFEDPVESALQARQNRRRHMTQSIRGWMREHRHPRLTTAAFLGLCAIIGVGAGYGLASCGLRNWGARAFWSVLAVWPIFILLVRWRVAVDAQHLVLGARAAHFIARDELAERESWEGVWDTSRSGIPEIDRALSEEAAQIVSRNPLTFFLLGGMTLGTWLIWDLTRNGVTLLAETLLDAEVIPPRMDLVASVRHRDWWSEALGFTALYFGGLAFAAGMVGLVLPYLIGR